MWYIWDTIHIHIYHVLQGLECVNVLTREDLVEGPQSLPQLDVKTSVPQCSCNYPVSRALVTGLDGNIILCTILQENDVDDDDDDDANYETDYSHTSSSPLSVHQ